jgi:hypothetical protein
MATLEAATQHIIQMADDYSATLSQSKVVEKLLEKSSATVPSRTPAASSLSGGAIASQNTDDV